MDDIFREPLTSKEDVYARAAMLLAEIEEWHETNPTFREEGEEWGVETIPPEELMSLHKQLEEFLEIVAAHPDYRDLIVSWMIQIDGYEGLSKKRLEMGKKKNIEQETVDEIFGSLGGFYQAVESFLKKSGYDINERSACAQGWTLGVICADFTANEICEKIHKKFKKAILQGMISVKKSFWGYRLIGLSAENHEEFLPENMDEEELAGEFDEEEADLYGDFDDLEESEDF